MSSKRAPSAGLAVVALLILFATLQLEPVSIGQIRRDPEPCEREALQAYGEALKVCELSRTENPRLRCYEAAKAVYRQALEQCRAEHH